MAKTYSVEERKNYCANWRTSGLCKIRFCKDQHISESALYKWLKLYDKDFAKSDTKEQDIKFLAVEPIALNKLKSVEIKLPNGILLKTEIESVNELVRELLR